MSSSFRSFASLLLIFAFFAGVFPFINQPSHATAVYGTNEIVSISSEGVQGNGHSDYPSEIIFRTGKVEVGFDHYELRSWIGWHHHMLFAFLAHHFLLRMRIFFKQRAPALTVYQVRLLLVSVLPMPKFTPALAIRMVRYYQRRNYTAYISHRNTRLERLSANLAL